MSHAWGAAADFPELVATFHPGAKCRVTGAHEMYDEIVGVDRSGYVIVAASRHDRPGLSRVASSFLPSRVVVLP